jgi:hypothetical protein
MDFHRQDPPDVRDSAYAGEGAVRGALALGVRELTEPTALAQWDATTLRG